MNVPMIAHKRNETKSGWFLSGNKNGKQCELGSTGADLIAISTNIRARRGQYLSLMEMGIAKIKTWIWKTTRKNDLNWSNISMKKYQNSPRLGVRSLTASLPRNEDVELDGVIWQQMAQETG